MKKLWLLLGLLFLAAPVFGAAVPSTGTFNCSTLTNPPNVPNPIANQTWCFFTGDGQIYVYNGSGYSQISGGSGSGSVTSVGAVGTANQITVTGTSPITTAGSWTFSIPAGAQLNVAKLTNLTSNGCVQTSGADGTLSVGVCGTGSGSVTSVGLTMPTGFSVA